MQTLPLRGENVLLPAFDIFDRRMGFYREFQGVRVLLALYNRKLRICSGLFPSCIHFT